METLRITALIGVITLFGACSEQVDKETLTSIEERLAAIENIDARISETSREKEAIEAKLLEVRKEIDLFEKEQKRAFLAEKKKLTNAQVEAFAHSEWTNVEDLFREALEIAEENARLKKRIDELEAERGN